MEYRIEEGDPLLRLRCSIIPNLNTGTVYIIVQQIKQKMEQKWNSLHRGVMSTI